MVFPQSLLVTPSTRCLIVYPKGYLSVVAGPTILALLHIGLGEIRGCASFHIEHFGVAVRTLGVCGLMFFMAECYLTRTSRPLIKSKISKGLGLCLKPSHNQHPGHQQSPQCDKPDPHPPPFHVALVLPEFLARRNRCPVDINVPFVVSMNLKYTMGDVNIRQ